MARPARDFIDDLRAAPDDLPVRGAWAHTRDKLGILRYYVPGFTTACKGKSPEFYFVDGLAGEGIYEFGDDGSRLIGSTLISLAWGVPPFTKCVAIDLNARKIDALRRRTADYGDRAVVELGDCNSDLLPLMHSEIPDWAPLLVFLDPEGFELKWGTVRAISQFKGPNSKYKPELLILVATGGAARAHAGAKDDRGLPRSAAVDLAFPPGSRWAKIVARQLKSEISSEAARDLLAEEYALGLRRLGYVTVLRRRITRPGVTRVDGGTSVYHLLFATDNPTGEKIMNDAFARVWVNPSKKVQEKLSEGQQLLGTLLFDD